MHRLILNPGAADEQSFEVSGGTMTIGRTEESDVCVLNKSLSRRHARLEVDDGRIVIVDLQSKNGTFVNGVKVSMCELHADDSFRCGDVSFKLVASRPLPSGGVSPTLVREVDTQLLSRSIDELLEGSPPATSALKVKPGHREDRAQDKFRVLLKISQLLSSPGPIDSTLERILQLAFQILEIDRAAILLVEDGALRPRITKTLSGEVPPLPVYSQHIVDYVRTHNVAALFSDAQQDSRLETASSVMTQSICSSMCVPLNLKEGQIGVLYVDNLAFSSRFSEEDLEFLTAFANQAAIAIENSNLYRRLEEEAVLRSNYMRFFPPATIQRLQRSDQAPLEVIETEVTALFADISDFVELSEQLQPRQVMELLNEYFSAMAEVVFRHEGTLDKYIGDALLAVWGAPFSHPEDVDRALRAAVEMHRALVGLNERWRAQGRVGIQVHMGINTGRVAAGNLGSERFLQYATIGDAMNVASRVCSLAGPGELLISESTFERWRDRRWPTTKLPPVQVKGKTGALQLHQVEWRAEPVSRAPAP